MMKIKHFLRFNTLSIQKIIIIVFVASIILITGIMSVLVFLGWISSTNEHTEKMATEMNMEAFEQIDDLIYSPEHFLEYNRNLLEANIVDLTVATEREKFFVSALDSHTLETSNIGFATVEGEFYGARRDANGKPELIRSDSTTDGYYWFYSVNGDKTAGHITEKAGKLDPRSSIWYISAKRTGKTTFSTIYRHFLVDGMTLTVSCPVYHNDELTGVLIASIILPDLNSYLEDIVREYNGTTLIIDRSTEEMIANSIDYNNFQFQEDGTVKRFKIEDLDDPLILKAFRQYRSSADKNFLYESEEDSYYFYFQNYHKTGLDWLIITAMPKSFFIADILHNMKMTSVFIVLSVLAAILAYLALMRKLVKPVNHIMQTTEELSSGDLSQRVPIYRNDELGKISVSINKMADTIYNLVHNLEATVQERTAELEYLSFHDSLTGLLNRGCFERLLINIDNEKNLPLSIIFADIDGLKMTNDIFGHDAGDELIVKIADILKGTCRNTKDFAARLGGDEFVVVLPNTDAEEAKKILAQIKNAISAIQVTAIKCSISAGFATKSSSLESINETLTNAENHMYKQKTLNRKQVNSDILQSIIKALHEKSPKERQHSLSVSWLCTKIGQALKLPETEVKRLEQAGYLHDIGKIALDVDILLKDTLSKEEKEVMQQHSVIGYRILNLIDETLDLAEGVYSHHERWDGSGYPKELRGKEIPKTARIIAIAEIYDSMTNGYNHLMKTKDEALHEIERLSGLELDPEITKVFIEMMR